MIARCWRGWTVESDSDDYLRYLRVTGIAKMSEIPGNLGTIVLRHLSHGRTEFLLISFWSNWEAIGRFAGPDSDRAVFYPEDENFLIAKEHHVDHFEVAHSEFPSSLLDIDR